MKVDGFRVGTRERSTGQCGRCRTAGGTALHLADQGSQAGLRAGRIRLRYPRRFLDRVNLRTFHALPTDVAIALELQNGETYELRQVRRHGFEASYRFIKPVPVERLIHENWNFPKRQLRLNLVMPLVVSTLTQRANAVSLNISQQGARVESDAVFAIDQSVRIHNDFVPEIRCKVRWRRDANYGLAFDNFFTLREFALLAARVQCPILLTEEFAQG